jgi:hypothetical protein
MGFGISYINRSQNFYFYLKEIIDSYKDVGYDCNKDELFIMNGKYKAIKSFQKGIHNYFLVLPTGLSKDRNKLSGIDDNKEKIYNEITLSNEGFIICNRQKIVQIYHFKNNAKTVQEFLKHLNILKSIPKKSFIRSIDDFYVEDTKRSLKIFISQDYSTFISIRDFLENIYNDIINSKLELNLVRYNILLLGFSVSYYFPYFK